jgi:hypothetical protein
LDDNNGILAVAVTVILGLAAVVLETRRFREPFDSQPFRDRRRTEKHYRSPLDG